MEVIYLDEVNSTNQYCKQNLDLLADRTVISANRQTAGKGRLNRAWLDLGEGNLFVSIVLKPSCSFDEKFASITQYLSVVICKLLENYGLKPQIKWPNDVLVNDKKIAGILSETVMQGTLFKGLVLGFGINISADSEDVKKVTDKKVTSLCLELSKYIDKNTFLNDLLNLFFNDYENFLNNGFSFIKQDYINYACFLNKEISVKIFNETKTGIAKSVNDFGALDLENDKQQFVLTIGDIL